MVFIRKAGVIANSNQIADGVITTSKLADNAVTSVKIADNAVSLTKIADNSVNSNKIVDASIGNIDIANNTISAGKLVTDSLVKFVSYSGLAEGSGVDILTNYSSSSGIAKIAFFARAEHSATASASITLKITDSGGNTIITKSSSYSGSGGLSNSLVCSINVHYTASAPTMTFNIVGSFSTVINAFLLIITK
jgi:hypothetical protein